MKLKKVMPILFFCSMSILEIYGQTIVPKNELTVGDQAPDYVFDTIINSNKSSGKLSDYRGKLVILDTWSPNCGSCIADMPRKEALQKKYGDRISILPIAFLGDTTDTKFTNYWRTKYIPNFWNTNQTTSRISLPSIIDSKMMLIHNFYIMGPGLQIWIDAKGVLLGLTSDEYVNENEIDKVLNGENVSWPIWKRINYNYEKPIFSISDSSSSKIYYSMMSPHKQFVSSYSTLVIDSVNGTKRYSAVNSPILGLYNFVFSNFGQVPPHRNRIILKISDSSRFIKKNEYYENWWIKNTYCYELVTSMKVHDSALVKKIKDDIDNYLSLSTSIKSDVRKYIFLGKSNVISNTQLQESIKISKYSCTLKEFVRDWSYKDSELLPVLYDKKHENDTLWLPIMNWDNREKVKIVLKNNGIDFRIRSGKIPMILITDEKNRK